MDQYSAKFVGVDLEVEGLLKLFTSFKVRSIQRKGSAEFELEGQIRKRRSSKEGFECSFVEFDANDDNLLDFLVSIENLTIGKDHLNIEQTEIWALLERHQQINGELSAEVISKLHSINASYCWSVLLSE
ncbi:hypothetical protein [Bradyrhizobium japonicum]|uniref:hypothetical protein n=1 Tax=Bradyrhizobium japonicum TaxID=375 RepID=UPI001BA749CE|nr:hypothetical protein [Bradyrhizobium japonicum]MBR0959532.1 hypothetical protein [Bradyrhizobium japonicum]